MKNIHVIPSIDKSMGGPSKSVSDLALSLAPLCLNTTIFTQRSSDPYLTKSPHQKLDLNFVESPISRKKINQIISSSNADILHGHGLWQLPVHYMSSVARKRNIPYIITPRGMLEPWALNANSWKKKIALRLYQRKDLSKANCIHATADSEAENIFRLGFKNPIAVIPNGIELSEFQPRHTINPSDEKTLLFLSRIHPKKGIELLIDAWELIDYNLKKGWQIKIAGNGEKTYIQQLEKIIEKKGLSTSIKIIGPRYGDDKIEAYKKANLFVLPTYSENFGIVIAEALACGVPVITTKGAPWADLEKYKAGMWVDIDKKSIRDAISSMLSKTEEERFVMGRNGLKLVANRYSIQSTSQKMVELYQWILNPKKQKPNFIY